MSIKLLYLKSGEQVISDVKELIRKDSDKVYGYVLHKPHEIVASKAVVLTEDADELQLDLLGNDPILSTDYIMKSIY